jgi:hypothetical protein
MRPRPLERFQNPYFWDASEQLMRRGFQIKLWARAVTTGRGLGWSGIVAGLEAQGFPYFGLSRCTQNNEYSHVLIGLISLTCR